MSLTVSKTTKKTDNDDLAHSFYDMQPFGFVTDVRIKRRADNCASRIYLYRDPCIIQPPRPI